MVNEAFGCGQGLQGWNSLRKFVVVELILQNLVKIKLRRNMQSIKNTLRVLLVSFNLEQPLNLILSIHLFTQNHINHGFRSFKLYLQLLLLLRIKHRVELFLLFNIPALHEVILSSNLWHFLLFYFWNEITDLDQCYNFDFFDIYNIFINLINIFKFINLTFF